MPRHLGYKHRDAKRLEERRFAALAELRHGKSAAEVARSFGVSIQSVQRWVRYSRDHVKHTLLPRLDWKWHKHTWLPGSAARNP